MSRLENSGWKRVEERGEGGEEEKGQEVVCERTIKVL